MKQRLWDGEFASGRWECLEDMPGDCLYPFVEKYAANGGILDLGCGPGATGNELDASKYSHYTGVDISEVAIAKARARTSHNDRAGKNEYVQADIGGYSPTRDYDVIVLGDSIYYISESRRIPMLRRYARSLTARGVFVVRIRGERPTILAAIERNFSVIEKQHLFDEVYVVVFR